MPVYEVKSVGDEPRAWTSSHGGTFLSYKVDLESDGVLARGVEWNKKDTSPAPSVGEQVAGILEDGKYGDKFKIDYEATKELSNKGSNEVRTGTAGSKNAGNKGAWQPESERDPERVARILRQHSQGLAVQVLTAMGSFGGKDAPTLHRWIKGWSDFFDQDANEVGRAANQAQGLTAPSTSADTSPPRSPESGSQPADDTHQYFCKLIEDAGLNSDAARALATFIVEKFDEDQSRRAETGLKHLDTQQDTLSKARIAYEKATGQLLPDPADADEVPF